MSLAVRTAKVSVDTARRWISVLETSLILFRLPTHPLRAKAFAHHRRQREMHFRRYRTGREIDLLLTRAEELYPVGIKSGLRTT